MIYLYIGLSTLIVLSIYLFIRIKKKGMKFIFGLTGVISLFVFTILLINPIFNNINFGLDLQGGFEILYQISPLDDNELDSDMVYNTYKAILKRIDILGVSEPEITIEGEDRIRVKLAGVTNKEEAREVISSTASLSFRDYNDNLLMTSDVLGGTAKLTTDQYGKPAVSLSIKDTETFYNVTKKISNMKNNKIIIWLDFDENDSYAKEKNTCGSLSTSHCISAASVNEAFASDVIIQGNFTQEEAKSLVELINSGALPTKLEEISSRTVNATYGENSLNKTLTAGIVGIILVMLLMIVIYKFSGFIASFCLALYTMLSLLFFYLINGVLTLPGIAAMLLGIGMAVDASVISYERIKDELKIGKKLDKAFKLGNETSITSIIDANITTLIVAIILFIMGQSSVKGFATMLIINIFVTIFVMVFLEKLILKLFVNSNSFDNKLNLFIGLKEKKIKKQENIIIPFQKLDFVGKGKYFIYLTLMLIVIGVGITLYKGFNLGVDFTGGTSITLNIENNSIINKIETNLKDKNYTIKKEEQNGEQLIITIDETLDKDSIKELANYLDSEYNTESDIFVVSEVVKQELTKNAIISLIVASIGIVIYVSIRFRFNYAISGLIALLHDVTMVILLFSIFRLEITSIFIAAILTIIGYSINDTIVTFDMVRTMYKKEKKISKDILNDIVNNSVRLTLFRTIMTSITTIIPVIVLILFGSKEIFNFNIALLIGFVVGTYSSIFISNLLWLFLEKKKISRPIKDKKDDEIEELKIKGINC